jgi:hypothetical protein
MIVVEAGHAHVMKFLQLSGNFCRCHCHFLGEKCGDDNFIYFLKLTIESENIELFCTTNSKNIEVFFCTQFNSCV